MLYVCIPYKIYRQKVNGNGKKKLRAEDKGEEEQEEERSNGLKDIT